MSSQNIIKVVGVGGAGSNAVENMYQHHIQGVDFTICNTDNQALANNKVPIKVQIGKGVTDGLGAGNEPKQGQMAAEESKDILQNILDENVKMIFITAGMGGGTGTGAAPILAKMAQEAGILTIGIVTIPFKREGKKRINQAAEGISKMRKVTDALLVVNNEKLIEIHPDLTMSKAFQKADEVLTIAAKSISEIITIRGLVNVDFADVKTIMENSGVALMGKGEAKGENRATESIELALTSPLLNNRDIRGARRVVMYALSGEQEITMDELDIMVEYVNQKIGDTPQKLIWGTGTNSTLTNELQVIVVATDFDNEVLEFSNAKKEVATMYNGTMGKKMLSAKQVTEMDFRTISKEDLDIIKNEPAFVRQRTRLPHPAMKIKKTVRLVSE